MIPLALSPSGVRHGPENVDPQVAGNRRPLAQHSRFRPGAAKPDLPRSQANLPAPSVLIKQLEAGGAAAELPEDASDRLEAYHDALEALAASSAVGTDLLSWDADAYTADWSETLDQTYSVHMQYIACLCSWHGTCVYDMIPTVGNCGAGRTLASSGLVHCVYGPALVPVTDMHAQGTGHRSWRKRWRA